MRIIFVFIVLSITVFPQIKIEEVGAGIGGGSVSGNSPSVAVFASNISLLIKYEAWTGLYFKTSFIYTEDIDRLLPEERANKYYSVMRSVSIAVSIKQELSEKIFLREGIGAAYLNDRIFPDQNEWAAGASTFISLNYNFNDKSQNKEGFSLALQLDHASAFSGTAPTLTIFSLMVQKSF